MRRRGLTVIELIAALAITALAATIGGATLALLGDHRDRLREAAVTARGALVRRTVIEWLEGAHGASGLVGDSAQPAFQLFDITNRGRAVDELQFMTTAVSPSGGADMLVRLYVDAEPRTPERGLVAELATWPVVRTVRMELDSTVTELEIRCLTDLLGTRRWVSSWMSASLVPRGMELRLRAGRDAPLDPLLRLPIVVAIEGGR